MTLFNTIAKKMLMHQAVLAQHPTCDICGESSNPVDLGQDDDGIWTWQMVCCGKTRLVFWDEFADEGRRL